MTEHIHTCNYECLNPACVLSQRDELVKRIVEDQKEWVRLTLAEIDTRAGIYSHPHIFSWGSVWAQAKLKEKNHD